MNIYFCIFILILFKIISEYKADDIRDYICPQKNNVDLFIVTHKDFRCFITNKAYKILADGKSSLKKKYPLEVIYTDKNNELFPKRIGYCECSKIYYIWKNYYSQLKDYVGFFHYRRFFNFNDLIPDMDELFKHHDVVLNYRSRLWPNFIDFYNRAHWKPFMEQALGIMKKKFPEFYKTALKLKKRPGEYLQNIFIMKKQDFKKYGEFLFGIFFEFDKLNNFTTDNDMLNWAKAHKKRYRYQRRVQGFLSERISNVFFHHYFKRPISVRRNRRYVTYSQEKIEAELRQKTIELKKLNDTLKNVTKELILIKEDKKKNPKNYEELISSNLSILKQIKINKSISEELNFTKKQLIIIDEKYKKLLNRTIHQNIIIKKLSDSNKALKQKLKEQNEIIIKLKQDKDKLNLAISKKEKENFYLKVIVSILLILILSMMFGSIYLLNLNQKKKYLANPKDLSFNKIDMYKEEHISTDEPKEKYLQSESRKMIVSENNDNNRKNI